MKKGFFVVVLLFLTACAATPLHQFHVNTYEGAPQIPLMVGDIQVQSAVLHYDKLPHMEYKLPVTPESVLKQWASHRFEAISMSSPITAEIIIKQAYMTMSDQKNPSWYKFDNVSYRLTYQVDMLFKKGGQILNEQTVKGWEEASIPQKSSLAEKEKTWESMLNAMVRKVDTKISADIPAAFK